MLVVEETFIDLSLTSFVVLHEFLVYVVDILVFVDDFDCFFGFFGLVVLNHVERAVRNEEEVEDGLDDCDIAVEN